MKSTGIVRRVDELGRIVVPIELRRSLDIGDRDTVEMYLEGDNIIIRKYQPSCVFCGTSSDITLYREKMLCLNCIGKIAKD
ncbi:MAG: AbrB/MazE/SpoVT family DNA-binding domain-containing protein [Clostridia bacterium]